MMQPPPAFWPVVLVHISCWPVVHLFGRPFVGASINRQSWTAYFSRRLIQAGGFKGQSTRAQTRYTLKNSIWTAMRIQATLTYSLFLSPMRDAFQQIPLNPSCLTVPSGAFSESKIVFRRLRRYVHVTVNRRITVKRLEKSKIADCRHAAWKTLASQVPSPATHTQ
jgi:hypothetical protein